MLDSTKLKKTFGWHPNWNIDKAIAKTIQWTRAWQHGENILAIMDEQIEEFIEA